MKLNQVSFKALIIGSLVFTIIAMLIAIFSYEYWTKYREKKLHDIFSVQEIINESLGLIKSDIKKYIDREGKFPQTDEDVDFSVVLSMKDKIVESLSIDPRGIIIVIFDDSLWSKLPPDARGKKVLLESHASTDEQGLRAKPFVHCQIIDMPIKYLPRYCVRKSWSEVMAQKQAKEEARHQAEEERIRQEKKWALAQIILPEADEVEQYLKLTFAEGIKYYESHMGALDILSIGRAHFGNFLLKHRIFNVCADGLVFGWHRYIPPSKTKCGFFATNGKQMWYLSQNKQKSVEELLRRESTQLEVVNAEEIANFFTYLLINHGHNSHIILSSSADVKDGSGYSVDHSERPKYEGKIHTPKVTGNKKAGWTVELYTMSGLMHEKQVVGRHLIKISPQYNITHNAEILSRQVFSETPNVEY